jgi:hypothetical protein
MHDTTVTREMRKTGYRGATRRETRGRHLVARRSAALLAARMHRWLVSCLRMANLKLSADWPLVPRSRANGGRKEGGGTMHTIPHRSPWSRKQEGLLPVGRPHFSNTEHTAGVPTASRTA